MNSHADSHYRPTTVLAFTLVAAVAFFVVMAIVVMWSTSQELELLGIAYRGSVLYDDWIYANDQRQAVVAGFAMLSFAATAGLYLRWVYVTTENARAFVDDLPARPVASILWYFVPGAHAWLPLRHVRSVYRASDSQSGAGWRDRPVPRFLYLWWTLWLVFQLMIVVSMASDLLGPRMEYLLLGASAATVAAALAVPLGVSTALAVWRLSALQARRARAIAGARPEPARGPWPGGAAQRV